jgi:hypothetical protein
MRALVTTFVFVALGASALACDDLNRPMAVPHSEPRRGCFTEVECPSSMKCWKGPQDIQGVCELRDAPNAPNAPNAADASPPSAPATDGGQPSPAPGELQL